MTCTPHRWFATLANGILTLRPAYGPGWATEGQKREAAKAGRSNSVGSSQGRQGSGNTDGGEKEGEGEEEEEKVEIPELPAKVGGW
jgi:hypothetical protein